MSDPFVNCHLHDDGSIMDSPSTIKHMLDAVKAKGQTACALTDHGSMLNTIDFITAAKERGIKPLIGMETYIADEGIKNHDATRIAKTNSALAIESGILGISHMVLLAKNMEGYRNLCRLSAIAHTEGYYYSPRIDLEALEAHKEGLIVTTACMFGSFSKMVDRGDYAKAEKWAGRMVETFGDDFYIELQQHGFESQSRYIPKAIEIARRVGANLVATQDAHYAKPEDWVLQDALFCIGTHSKLADEGRRTACKEMYVKSRSEIEASFAKYGVNVPAEALDNTMKIAAKVEDYKLQPKDYLFPSFLGSKQLSEKKLEDLCKEGWKRRVAHKIVNNEELRKVYQERVRYELAVIKTAGFADYFLIVQDFINKAKANGKYIGPGRGSVAGCLVGYLLDIHDVDSVQYNLLFERFLVPGRPTMPDIDVDVSDRDFVIHYLEEKYGRDKIAPIINRTEITSKSALNKVSSILGDYQFGQEISKLIKKDRGQTPKFEEVLKTIPEVALKAADKPQLLPIAMGLEGTIIGVSGHASGVVISSVPITDIVPMHRSKDVVYTAYDMDQIAYMKLIKLDILGLSMLRAVDECIKLIKQRHGVSINLEMDPTDKRVYDLFCRADTIGVFQFGTAAMRDTLKKLQPHNLAELAFVNALGRPGALDNPGLMETFIARKLGKEKVTFAHPALEPILASTYGFPIYQEQIMKIVNQIGGLSIIDTDAFRKAMSKKDESIINVMKPKFIDGCMANGYPKELAEDLFNQALLWCGYGFNISHSTAYSLLGYQTAWLKTYYPLEFLVSCVNTEIWDTVDEEKESGQDKQAKIVTFVMDLEAHGFKVKSPSISKSNAFGFSISTTEVDPVNHKPVIYYGLAAIKDVSPDQVNEWQKLGPFKSVDDAFLKSLQAGCNSTNLRVLSMLGAFEELAPNTQYLVDTFDIRLKKAKALVAKAKNKLKPKKPKKPRKKKGATAEDMEAELEVVLYGVADDVHEAIENGMLETMTEPVPIPPLDWSTIEFSMGDLEQLMEPSTDELAKIVRLRAEMDYLGCTISGSLLEEYSKDVMKKAQMITSWFVTHVKDQEWAKVAGVITALTFRNDKHGRKMAFATISDGRSDVRALIFSSLYARFQESTWKTGKAVAVNGRRDGASLIATDLTFLRKDNDQNEKANSKENNDTGNLARGHANPEQHRASTPSSAEV